MKPNDYELRAALAKQAAVRQESGWVPPVKANICRRPHGKWAPGERCTFVAGHLGPHSWKKRTPDLWVIAKGIMEWVGNCIPDGDPIDHLIPLVRRECGLNADREPWEEGCNVTKWLDKACRKHLGCNSYNQYLINAWDGWNEVCEEDQRMENPWRPMKPQRKVVKRNHK